MLRIFANNLASATCCDLFCFAGLLHVLNLGIEVVSLFPTANGFDQQALTVTTFDSIDAVSCKCGIVWPNHSCRHTRKTNLHLPGAHQWSRIRPSRLVQTLAATASRLTFAVLCPMLHCVFAEFTNQLATCWKIYGTIASSLVGASHRVPMTSIRQRVIHQQSFQPNLV
jgi:hypothetical protein